MKTTVINEKDIVVSKWAGGESRQYYIYPPESNYSKRDFMFRVSMATSYSDEKANYTNLENFTRYLVMLEGTANVFHKGHYDVILKPFDYIDVFDGGWDSSASGKVVDFNLMTSKNITAGMCVVEKSDVVKIGELKGKNWLMFFCGSGSTSFELPQGECINIFKNDLIIFEDFENTLEINVKLIDSKLIKMFVSI